MAMKIYVSNFLGKCISIIDGYTLEEERIYVEESVYPHHFCIDKDEEIIYIPSSVNGFLYRLSIKDKKIIDSISIGGNLSQVVLYKDEELFVANEDSNSIYIVNAKNLNPIGVICVDNMPHGMILDETLNKLYVPCGNLLVIIDVISKTIVQEIRLNFQPWHLKIDEIKNILYVVTKCEKIVLLDRFTFRVIKVLDYFKLPIEIGINHLRKEIYVTDFCDKSIYIIEEEQYKIVEKIKISGRPLGLDLSKDKKFLFISDIEENNLKVIDLQGYAVVKEIQLDKEPTTIICR